MKNVATIQAILQSRIVDKEYDALVKEESKKLADWIDNEVFEKLYGSAESYKK